MLQKWCFSGIQPYIYFKKRHRMKILMVCLGNICRSPLAQGIMEDLVAKNGLDWEVDSAGTGSWHIGAQPDIRSMAVAKKYGIDISGQQARRIRPTDFETFDLIYAMDTTNFHDLERWALDEAEKSKIRLILNETSPGENRSVPDPYWDDNGFEAVFTMLREACEVIIEKQRKAVQPG
jgi:protein-tyrosine phosphatase